MIAPIPTSYKGYKMRSRTEARWAVFFDALGLAWRYEVEGFDLGAAGLYLPDFWLPDLRLWCEVKGSDPAPADLRKLQVLAEGQGSNVLLLVGEPGAPEALSDYEHGWAYSGRLFVGDFATAERIAEHYYGGRHHFESLADFLQEKVEAGLITGGVPAFDGSQTGLQTLLDLDRQYYQVKYGRDHPQWEYGYTLSDLRWAEGQPGRWSLSWAIAAGYAEHTTPALLAAYQAARSARFEHGEQPSTVAPGPIPDHQQLQVILSAIQQRVLPEPPAMRRQLYAPRTARRSTSASAAGSVPLALRRAATHTLAELCAAPADQVGVLAGRLIHCQPLLFDPLGPVVRAGFWDPTGWARMLIPAPVYSATLRLWVPGHWVLLTGRLAPQAGDYAGVGLFDGRTLPHTILEVQTVQELPA